MIKTKHKDTTADHIPLTILIVAVILWQFYIALTFAGSIRQYGTIRAVAALDIPPS